MSRRPTVASRPTAEVRGSMPAAAPSNKLQSSSKVPTPEKAKSDREETQGSGSGSLVSPEKPPEKPEKDPETTTQQAGAETQKADWIRANYGKFFKAFSPFKVGRPQVRPHPRDSI